MVCKSNNDFVSKYMKIAENKKVASRASGNQVILLQIL